MWVGSANNNLTISHPGDGYLDDGQPDDRQLDTATTLYRDNSTT